MIKMETAVTVTGPLFDGRAAKAVTAFLEESKVEVSQAGVNEVRNRLGQVLEHPSGRYRNRIVTDLVQGDPVVSDGGMVYGPWLEGTSSRNKTTRFKGYQTFRKTRQWLAGRAGSIAEAKIRPYLTRMGGE